MNIAKYNLVWDKPGKNSKDSMPLGNGDIGINLWVEENGDILFYIGKTDTWSENARLLKLGLIRLKAIPNPFKKGMHFSQILDLKNAEIKITAGNIDYSADFRIWIDSNNPVINIEAESGKPIDMSISLEIWRTRKRNLRKEEMLSAYGLHGKEKLKVQVFPDTVLPSNNNDIIWYHRNRESIWHDNMSLQGLNKFSKKQIDPLLKRTFGGIIKGKNCTNKTPLILKSKTPLKKHFVCICSLTEQTTNVNIWIRKVKKLVSKINSLNFKKRKTLHRKWWKAFWNRSSILAHGNKNAEMVTKGYMLQRFINACGGRGNYPVKFNGSIFNVDEDFRGKHLDADFRNWGGPYWFQNTRLIYWPMLYAGDFDMMMPFFDMYLKAFPLAKERTRIFFNHKGAYYPETIYFWGTYVNNNYGWNRKSKHVSFIDNGFIRYYYSGTLELSAMILAYYSYTGDNSFLKKYLPIIDGILTFYDRHFPRYPKGKLNIAPSQSLETWWKCKNPMPDIAGLRFILKNILSLPENGQISSFQKKWEKLLKEIPEIPLTIKGKKVILAPAESFDIPRNCENTELYAVFPYRIYGLGKPGLKTAITSFKSRKFKNNFGWDQSNVQAALLGLTNEARKMIIERVSKKDKKSRFPAFWAQNFDWIPDQDHGGNILMALQFMLMQCEEEKIILFPAWPKNWDVNFKLHAPKKTVVEVNYESKTIKTLKVTPKYRKKDIVSFL